MSLTPFFCIVMLPGKGASGPLDGEQRFSEAQVDSVDTGNPVLSASNGKTSGIA